MKVVGVRTEGGGGIDVLEEFEVPIPELRPRDILIRIISCACNPIDTKVRAGALNVGKMTPDDPKILGYDGSGTVEALGADATLFKVGDKVFFAGSIIRNGTNAEMVAMDERIVGRAPSSISATVASSVPLTALTAWEGLEQLGLDPNTPGCGTGKKLLMLPGAGGVGSMVIPLAKLCGLEVIATASRPESIQAAKNLGADHSVNHREPLLPQLEALGIRSVDFIYDAHDFEHYADEYFAIIKPFGKIVQITKFGSKSHDQFKKKSVVLATEFMFARSMWDADDIAHQGEILNMVSVLLDEGKLQASVWKQLSWSLENLREAHALQQSGKATGKIVLTREG